MKRVTLFLLIVLFVSGISCNSTGQKPEESIVTVTTDFGTIKLKLYNDTPEHKKNFIKLVNEGFYNDLLFHRVIENFMIQGGDPGTRNAKAGQRLGGGSQNYTIPAEFNAKHFHKRGALAAARTGGPANPEKRSSGSQFYIIQGKIFTPGALDTLEMMTNSRLKNEIAKECFTASQAELNKCRENNDQLGFNNLVTEIRIEVDSIYDKKEKLVFTEEQRNIYTTEGGYPSLDGDYTVFGEVIEGLDVLDKIAVVETDKFNRPLLDVKMQVKMGKK